MTFDEDHYSVKEAEVKGERVRYRAFERIPYVDAPADADFQVLSIYVPEVYYKGGQVGSYTLRTAPVFFPNSVGGYRPGEVEEPGYKRHGDHFEECGNSCFYALLHGYVVVSAGIRGRSQTDPEGRFIGKAPALVTDYKAAVRYLHKFADQLPGDEDKIIINGTSAGGALSAIVGASGCHPDYEPYLKQIGAADAEDIVYATSCYCPITNLEHADMAYEWEFSGVYTYRRKNMKEQEAGRPDFKAVDGIMPEESIRISGKLAKMFPAYVNALGLKDEQGELLTLQTDGTGSFQDYIKCLILDSANEELEKGKAAAYVAHRGIVGRPEEKAWLKLENGKAVDMDFKGWAEEITRMKEAPAFDAIANNSPENDEFGTNTIPARHFTAFSAGWKNAVGEIAEEAVIKLLNPMYYIGDKTAVTTKHWRIRHGERDRDTSLAISAMLALKLKEEGCLVDYKAPWEQPHSGDYDLDELFAWIDGICR